MKRIIYEIIENKRVGKDIFLLTLKGSTKDITSAGEFVNIKLNGYYLRRPLSVCCKEDDKLYLLYKVLGKGTHDLSGYKPNEMLDVLVGLGNGFDRTRSQKPLLIAGGIGIAPMIELIRNFEENGIRPTLLYGSANQEDIVFKEWLTEHCDVIFTTDDGSYGFDGNVIDYLKQEQIEFDYYYACGPIRMLQALSEWNNNGCLSLEARMGCGFGACMGCSIRTKEGPKRVCKEGPVFEASEVIF